jgi:hypothetical protein
MSGYRSGAHHSVVLRNVRRASEIDQGQNLDSTTLFLPCLPNFPVLVCSGDPGK